MCTNALTVGGRFVSLGIDFATGEPKRISRYAATKEDAVKLLHEELLTVIVPPIIPNPAQIPLVLMQVQV